MIKDYSGFVYGTIVGGAIGEACAMTACELSGTPSTRLIPGPVIGPATKAALFVCNGLMLGDTRLADKGIGSPHVYDGYAYGAWTYSNTTVFGSRQKTNSRFWLLYRPEMYFPTPEAIASMPLFRVAPHALYELRFYNHTPEWVVRYISEDTTLSPSAAMLIFVLMEIYREYDQADLSEITSRYLRNLSNNSSYMSPRLGFLLYKILDGERPVGIAKSEEEILAAALYCCLYQTSYETVITESLSFQGQREAIAHIAGTIAGALNRYTSIPDNLRQAFEHVKTVQEMAADMVSGAQLSYGVTETPQQRRWSEKYL